MQNKDQILDVLRYILNHLEESEVKGYMAKDHDIAIRLVRHFLAQGNEIQDEKPEQA